MKSIKRPLIVLALCCLSAAPALAQRNRPEQGAQASGNFLIVTYGDWGVFTTGKDKGKVCFALSQPKDRAPKGLNRDPAYFYVTNRIGDGARNEVSLLMGYPLKAGGPATIAVGGTTFQLQAKDKSAWLRNAAEEGQLVEAMKKAKDVVVKGTSAKGNETTDRYSLSGLGQAIERAQKECP